MTLEKILRVPQNSRKSAVVLIWTSVSRALARQFNPTKPICGREAWNTPVVFIKPDERAFTSKRSGRVTVPILMPSKSCTSATRFRKASA